MKPSRFSAMHINIAGIVMALVFLAVVYFVSVRPKAQDTEIQTQAAAAAVNGGGTEEANRSSANEVVKSKKETVQILKDWAVYDKVYMPKLLWDKDLLNAYYFSNKINEIPVEWGKWVTAWYDAQKRDGITRSPGVEFPVPPIASDPNGIANLTSITFPAAKTPWKVSLICQTFDDAMAHLRRFRGMTGHGMPVVDDVALSGHSPQLNLTYNLSLYVIPGEAPPPPDSRIGAAGGGGGGMMGGPSMGAGPGMMGTGGMMGGTKGMGSAKTPK